MPWARFSLPLTRAGTVRISMTASMTGRSSTRLELMPNSVALCGMVKGASVIDMPLTSTRLKTFAPTTLPSDRSLWPLTSEVTAVTSLVKGHSDLSLGNVVGANVFNLVLVSGVSVTLAPFTIPQSNTLFGINSSLVMDLPVMLAVMLILTLPALLKGKLNRAQGILLLAIYAAFCAVQFTL